MLACKYEMYPWHCSAGPKFVLVGTTPILFLVIMTDQVYDPHAVTQTHELPSRLWSTDTFKQGVAAVRYESKQEPWTDDESDENLHQRIQDWLFSMLVVCFYTALTSANMIHIMTYCDHICFMLYVQPFRVLSWSNKPI